jgi:hypothetical protein
MIYSRPMRTETRIMPALLLAAVAVIGAACGDDDGDEATPTEASGTVTERPTATPATPSPIEEPFEGTQEPVEATPPPGITTALLVNVKTQVLGPFDRVTFEFREGLPGFRIEYVEPPIIADPSGLQVEIDGAAFLQVRMERAAGHDPDTGQQTYTGGLELTPGLPQVLELERTGDFEGVLTWAIGMNSRADFRVLQVLEDPPGLVIEVKHPGSR